MTAIFHRLVRDEMARSTEFVGIPTEWAVEFKGLNLQRDGWSCGDRVLMTMWEILEIN